MQNNLCPEENLMHDSLLSFAGYLENLRVNILLLPYKVVSFVLKVHLFLNESYKCKAIKHNGRQSQTSCTKYLNR